MNDVSGEIRRVVPGDRLDLRAFRGRGYKNGRPVAVQILGMIVSRNITMRWWCPNVLRVSMLHAFGAVIDPGVLVRHDVKIHWP
jgi:putative colanic acid biosynthesis acetyltransferase WcaF